MTQNQTGVDQKESAQNITVTLTLPAAQVEGSEPKSLEIPVSRVDATKEVEINQIRESSVKANGFSVTAIDYSGTIMFQGTRFSKGGEEFTLDEVLYKPNGVPRLIQINIYHELDDEPEIYQDVMVNSEAYESRNEETSETSYDWIAMDRNTDQAGGN